MKIVSAIFLRPLMIGLLSAGLAHAHGDEKHPKAQSPAEVGGHAAAQTVAQAAPLSEGEVRKVDQAAGKITIKHGPLDNLAMPAMTMIFRVKNPAMLEQLKPGARIKFLVEKVNGALTVTTLEVVTP